VGWVDASGHGFSIDSRISSFGFDGFRCVPTNEITLGQPMSLIFKGTRGDTTAAFVAGWSFPQSLIPLTQLGLQITP
jgi:hypothetical protein